MAKRFTDTNKYRSPFYRSLQGAYKLLWDFLYHDCDHAGIWIVDFQIAQAYVGNDMPIDRQTALQAFNSDETRIIEIDGGKRWFLPGFIQFQYGDQLNDRNRTHASVMKILARYNLICQDGFVVNKEKNKPDISPLQGVKDMDKDKDKDKDFGKSENLLQPGSYQGDPIQPQTQIFGGASVLVVPEMLSVWQSKRKDYILTDDCRPAARFIAEYISKMKGIPDYTESGSVDQVVNSWKLISDFILTDAHFRDYSLSQVRKFFNTIVSRMKNAASESHSGKENETPKSGKTSIIQNNVAAAQGARNLLNKKYGGNTQ